MLCVLCTLYYVLCHVDKFSQLRIRKIRDAIPSVSEAFERLHKNPTASDSELGTCDCKDKLLL